MANELESECRLKFCSVIEKGNDLLIFQNFSDLLQLCQEEIADVQRYQKLVERSMEVNSEKGNLSDLMHYLSTLLESLCVLAIQAHAESGQHKEVLPYLKKCYHGVKYYPEKIIQMCILLYGKYEDYETAEPVYREWKKFPRNQAFPTYPGILELFIFNILLPQMKCNEAIKLTDSDSVIRADRKIALIKFIKKYEKAVKEENLRGKSGAISTQHTAMHGKLFPEAFNGAVKSVSSKIFQNFPFLSFTVIRRLALIGVLIYIILFKTNLDTVSGLAYAGQLWQSVTRLWKSMFAPYHVAAAP